jgi:cytochrome c553
MRRSAIVLALIACGRASPDGPPNAPPPATSTGWLSGDVDQRFARVARHLRGFDVAMVETGYRYGELYWAGQDRNWDYAAYQLDKIITAIEHGIERRPKRAESARMLEPAIASVRAAVQATDAAAFTDAFTTLTATCNACHAAERVGFVVVRAPSQRGSPVVGPGTGETP